MKKKILITGGLGMIGQEIARQLPAKEWEIAVFDNFSNFFTPRSGGIGQNLWEHNIDFHTALESFRPDVISHHAAAVGVGESMYKPEKYADLNSMFTAELIQAIIDTKWTGLLMHAGSMGVYGEQHYPVDENYRQKPLSFYGLSKKYQEDQLRLLVDTYPGIKLLSLRYFSVYSTKFNPENPFTGILGIIVDQILSGGPVELYGDGTQTRDMIHVSDVASIHNWFLEHPPIYDEVNVCIGEALTLKEITAMVCKEFEYNGPVVFNGKTRAGDLESSMGDNTRLLSLYPFKFHDLKKSIREYRVFIEANLDKIRVGSVKLENDNLKNRGLIK